MPTGARLFAQTLTQLKIQRVFTLVGDHLNEVLRECAEAGISIVGMRHESGVTHAADAYARVTRKPSVSLVTGGPGHTNSLTGIATAALACSPLIAVSGSRARAVADRNGFQDIDQIGMAKPVVKWAAEPPGAGQIPFYLRRAYSESISGRPGPVHLSIPVDVFTEEARREVAPVAAVAHFLPAPNEDDIERAVALLRASERPLMLAGSGVWWSDAGEELKAFVESQSLPLFTITMARGVVRDDHPLCFGFGDPALNRGSHGPFQEADVIVIVGKRIDFRLALGSGRVLSSAAKIIQIDVHPQELGFNRAVEVGIVADAKQALRSLNVAMHGPAKQRLGWMSYLAEQRSEWQAKLSGAAEDRALPAHPAAVFREISSALPEETAIAWDGGDFTHWGRSMTPALVAGGWVRLGPLATIGAALPNGIAMKIANPQTPVAVITGDGALGFYIAEMDTAVRLGLALVIIVGNDSGWGLERELQSKYFPKGSGTVACELRPTRYDLVMKGFGGEGETVERIEDIAPAIAWAFASGKPYCVNILVRGVRSPFTEWLMEGKKAQ